ncbi:C45 family autoproteolytic acyltransferase/hydolase [Pseudomonas plecoglossicida]|uniref:C45 family autoproteolytic acyltransferase/hydolase n=1 Tax=Pseudomonas plecoglossicida TaxID=70775 RepID=UPI003D235559
MKNIKLAGSDYNIGFQHGRACREEIFISLTTYKGMFEALAGLQWEDVQEIAGRELERLSLLAPDCCEEIKGIAAGSGFSLLDIVALNIRSEILFSLGSRQVTDGCTSIAVTPQYPGNGAMLLAQNWDWLQSQHAACVVLEVTCEQGLTYLTVTEAGILAKVGFNTAGIGVCLNALSTGYGAEGIPVHFHLRQILRQERLSAAMDQVIKKPHACAAHYLIASREGIAFGIEAAPSEVAVLNTENGILAHTNHLLHPRHSHTHDHTPKVMGASSYIRLAALRRATSGGVELSRESIKRMLANHDSHPEGVCQHPTGAPGISGQIASVFSIVMNLEERSADICLGNPCEGNYLRYQL